MTKLPVRIGVQIQPQHADFETLRSTVIAADRVGVDVVFNWDHFYPLSGDPDGAHFECWTLLASWAEVVRRAEIGALVACNGYRNPDLLADMARTVDHASRGRLILGIGSGWSQRDYDEYGYTFGTAGSRLDDLAVAIPRIQRRWERLNPAPTRKIPLLVGGGGERKTLRLVARHANIWHTLAKDDELRHKISVLKSHCAAEGRDMDEIEISSFAGVGEKGPEGRGEDYYSSGVRLFVYQVDGRDPDLAPLNDWLKWRDDKNSSPSA